MLKKEALMRYEFLNKEMERHRRAADLELSRCKDHLRRIYNADEQGRCLFDDGERYYATQIMGAYDFTGVTGKAKEDADFLKEYSLYRREISKEREATRLFEKFDAKIRRQNAGTGGDWWLEYCAEINAKWEVEHE